MFKINNVSTEVTPYQTKNKTKKEQVANMFNNIASNYDFLNHFLSLGIDILWRKQAVKAISIVEPKNILDIATGTGDLAIEATRLNPKQIIGIDISKEMLKVGEEKIKKKGLDSLIKLQYGDAEKLEFMNNSFDSVTAGFGVRNFQDLNRGLSEMLRVMKKGGKLAILEPSEPSYFPFKQCYNIYFKRILPWIGRMISKDSSAYTYLPESVENFPKGKIFLSELKKAGFKNVKHTSLSFGVAALYTGTK